MASEPLTRTSLTRFAGSMRDPDPAGPFRAARKAWQEHGIVVIMQTDRLDTLDRELVNAIANRLHGKRSNV